MNDKFKILIFYVDRLHHTDRWYFFLVEIFGKRIWESSVDLLALNNNKINCFLLKLSSKDVNSNQLHFYFEKLEQTINSLPDARKQFFPVSYLDEQGHFNYPTAFFRNRNEELEPPRSLEFADASVLKSYNYRRKIYISELDKGKPVFEWYRFQAYRWHDIESDTCAIIEAYCIMGNLDEKMYVHISLNSESQIVKINFLKSKGMDGEIGKYVMAHFRKEYIEKNYIFSPAFKP